MNVFSKKKMLEIVTDLEEGTKALKKVKDDLLPEVWIENIRFFGQLICMVGDYLISCCEEKPEYGVLVEVIEGFCGELQIVETQNLEGKERQKHVKELQKQLQKLHFELGRLVPEDKKELVFFPYLYAMWDSLASVWRAAVDSGEFDVYVVPIPYYEKKSDGSFGEMHYDGAEYPEEVGAISWESYNVAERKPDVAYIHNPYDDCNHVTSIHPDFYSEKLKPHVGSLVYIPYFVVVNDVIPDHFCITPVTVKADKIIAQSEKAKECYVSHLMQYGQKSSLNWSQKHLDEKVLGIGSPKLDQKKSQAEVLETAPEEWRSVIFKEDGSWKKVIFLNTSIGTLLEFGSLALDRLEDALMTFYLEQKEIAVLWRPHPLIESTYKSMKPQLYQRYLNIVKKFNMGNWGILDQSKDFNRAVALSDAYYGDPSSVVEIFKQAKKPVMISNCHISSKG